MEVPGILVHTVEGTPQHCIDHIHKKHNVDDSEASLGKTRAEWHTALKPKVSGISTDAALFSEHGAQLVHHYRMFGDCAAHASLQGLFMIDLLYFTNRACTDAHWEAKRSRNSGTGSRSSPDQPVPLPRNVKQRSQTTILQFTKLLGLSPRSCQTSHHRPAPRKSTMPRRCHRCVGFRSVGGDRSCLCRCHYRVLPCRVSRRISGSRLWL